MDGHTTASVLREAQCDGSRKNAQACFFLFNPRRSTPLMSQGWCCEKVASKLEKRGPPRCLPSNCRQLNLCGGRKHCLARRLVTKQKILNLTAQNNIQARVELPKIPLFPQNVCGPNQWLPLPSVMSREQELAEMAVTQKGAGFKVSNSFCLWTSCVCMHIHAQAIDL